MVTAFRYASGASEILDCFEAKAEKAKADIAEFFADLKEKQPLIGA